jgi:hypothetical protein
MVKKMNGKKIMNLKLVTLSIVGLLCTLIFAPFTTISVSATCPCEETEQPVVKKVKTTIDLIFLFSPLRELILNMYHVSCDDYGQLACNSPWAGGCQELCRTVNNDAQRYCKCVGSNGADSNWCKLIKAEWDEHRQALLNCASGSHATE